MNSNVLGRLFDWIGDALEHFNPSAYRFLAAVLPYLTPIPVAWLTANSSAIFLHFTPTVAFIFVFALEGIGLWFTSLFVDSVVDWVRSRNWKSFVPVLLFATTVSAYVFLLVNLNVTLEASSGNVNPALSKVITLLCFLPLITGVGNGYYKLKLEHKTELELTRQHQEEMELRRLAEQRQLEISKARENAQLELSKVKETSNYELLKLQERNRTKLELAKLGHATSGNTSRTSKSSETTSGTKGETSKMGRPSIHEQRVFSYMDEAYSKGITPTFTEVMRDLKLPQSTSSRLREKWINRR